MMCRRRDWYTDGERGTACRACRFVGIAGSASVRFDASITTEVAWFTQISISCKYRPAGLPQGVTTGSWSLSKHIGQFRAKVVVMGGLGGTELMNTNTVHTG
jgi:hypothetical protein